MISLTETATRIKISASNPEDLNALLASFKYRPDHYWMADSYILWKKTGKGWDGYLNLLKRLSDTLGVIKRGHLSRLLEVCKTRGIHVERKGLLPRPFSGMVIDDLPDDLIEADFELDEDQRRCIVDWLVNAIGINKVTVGGGKTAAFCAAASMVKRRFPEARVLYITPTERLVKQVFEVASKMLPSWSIAQFGGGKPKGDTIVHKVDYINEHGSDMVVATYQMLSKNREFLDKCGFLRTFLCLIYDEVHHSQSPSSEKLVLSIPAFFRFGASDTTWEGSDRKLKMVGLFGPVMNNIETAPLVDSGRLAKPHILLIDNENWILKFKEYPHQPNLETEAWVLLGDTWKRGLYLGPSVEYDDNGKVKLDRQKNPIQIVSHHRIKIDDSEYDIESKWCLLERTYDKAITTFKERNELIVEWAKYFSDQKKQTLIVCTRTLHISILHAMITKQIDPSLVKILYSDHSTEERDETFDWFKKHPGSVLISSIVKEGVSINEIQAGIIADAVSSWEYIRQILGRFLRKKVDGVENEAHIVMFIDRQTSGYRKNAIKLMQKLESDRAFTFYYPLLHPIDFERSLTDKTPLSGTSSVTSVV